MSPVSLDKSLIKILLLEGIHPSAVTAFKEAGYTQIEQVSSSLSEAELVERIQDVQFIGIRSRTQLTQAVFAAADKLLAVGCFCIGTNQVDLKAATERGILVFNAPFSNTRSVAEMVLAQAILLLRRIPEKNASAHRGGWQKTAQHSYESRGKVLGVVGYGNIGTQLGVIAESMGMRVIFYDVMNKLPLGNAQQVSSLHQLLSKADVVTLHVPETSATRLMIGANELAVMKDHAILINASRGTVVAIEALAHALESGKLLGAAIDVFPVEPRSNDDEFLSPLRGLDQVILTPHIGGSTVEAQRNIGAEVAEKLVMFSDNGSSVSAVNFPEVTLPTHEGKHRILHIHQNITGVLSTINGLLSEFNINISAQYLRTNELIGYVVIDVDQEFGPLALQKLSAVHGTIKARILF